VNRQLNKPPRSLSTQPLPKQHTLHKFLSLPKLTPYTASDEGETWGHMMDNIDHSKTLQILLQNPNGIRPSHTDLDFQNGLSKFNSFGVGVLSISETNLNRTKAATKTTYHWFHQTWQFSSLSSSQINENFSSYNQPGGTLTAVVDQWTSRVHSKGQDHSGLGRWSYITLQGKQDFKLTIITAYRVSQKSSASVGGKTAYMQQFRALQSIQNQTGSPGRTIEPNRQFILDLQAWIQFLQSQGHHIILNLDNNDDLYDSEGFITPLSYNPESITSDQSHSSSLQSLAFTCGLIDVLAIQHLAQPFPSTYIHGKKRLDYMLISFSKTLGNVLEFFHIIVSFPVTIMLAFLISTLTFHSQELLLPLLLHASAACNFLIPGRFLNTVRRFMSSCNTMQCSTNVRH